MKSGAPDFIASTAIGTSPYAVTKISGMGAPKGLKHLVGQFPRVAVPAADDLHAHRPAGYFVAPRFIWRLSVATHDATDEKGGHRV